MAASFGRGQSSYAALRVGARRIFDAVMWAAADD
jgi:hypothetical protein